MAINIRHEWTNYGLIYAIGPIYVRREWTNYGRRTP